MAQKVVLKVESMTDDRAKQKAIEAAADIYGVDSIEAAIKDQKLTVMGEMDTVAVVKKLMKKFEGKVEIVSVGPAAKEPPHEHKEEEEKKKKKTTKKKKKQEDKKEDKQEDKNEDKQGEEKGKREEDDEELMEYYDPLPSHYSHPMRGF